jgi:Mrr N-terminal domain
MSGGGPETPRTPQGPFRDAILQALVDLGGRAAKREVLDRVRALMSLTARDYEPNGQGRPYWTQRAEAACVLLRRDGYVSIPRHGVWALSSRQASGRAHAPHRPDE